MNPEQFTQEEQVLIERLQNAPQADIPTAVYEGVQTQLWDEMDNMTDVPVSPTQPQLPIVWLILAILAIIGLILLGLFFLNISRDTASIESTSTNNLIETSIPGFDFSGVITEINEDVILVGGMAIDITNAVLPVDDLSTGMTVQVVGVADGQIIHATAILNIDANPIEATQTIPSVTSSQPQETSDIPLVIVEGSVQAITVNSIRIFDIDIQVDPADPILTEIRIGDTIRIEGQSSIESNTIIIVAVNITIIETTVIVINNPGTIYIPVGIPANCKRTKKGKITCKNTRRR